jgi:outer membrane protein, heavy metal efflux system
MKGFLTAMAFIGILSLFSACTKVGKEDQDFVSSVVEKRLGKQVEWEPGDVKGKIDALLKGELCADAAVQIALLNNPKIQAIFEEIGISQADLVEAGLFSNPIFDLFIRYPNRKHFVADIEYTVAASFIDLFLVPLRKKVAKAELEKTTLDVANAILDLAFDVEKTFYELQASEQQLRWLKEIAEITSIETEIVLRQRQIGNVQELSLQEAESKSTEAALQVLMLQNEIIHLREKFNILLGLKQNDHWTMASELPEADFRLFPIERLEAVAFQERLDLQAARFEVLRVGKELGVKQWWVYTEGRIGIAGERDPDGLNTLGPAFLGQIPIFNYGQAARLRLRAELRQARDELATLEIRILNEVRKAKELLVNSLEMIEKYCCELLPFQNQLVDSSLEFYNVMGLGIDKLLANKREQLHSYYDYISSLRNYWLARVQLDRALGGKLYKVFSLAETKEGAE